MGTLRIEGGVRLEGQVAGSGSKNAALAILAASLVSEEPIVVDRVPAVSDVETLRSLLAALGVRTVRGDGRHPSAASDATRGRYPSATADQWADRSQPLRIETVDHRSVRAPRRLVARMRAGFSVLGPLLARRGKAIVPLPGGCRIGDRPVDLHLRGLAALGARLDLQRGYVVAQARRLRGATIDLAGPRGPTVTGTANVMSAAVLARGQTILHGASIEPEVVDLGRFLVALGARIEGLGTSTLVIDGVRALGGGTWRVMPDRIEAATLLLSAVATGGRVRVADIEPAHLASLLTSLGEMGVDVQIDAGGVTVAARDRLRAIDVAARPYPGLPTDVQAQLTAVLCLARGESRVRDEVFPARFVHVAELRRMGARIECGANEARITGVVQLRAATVAAADLRGGAALVLAALAARGRSRVERTDYLERGYERLDEKLAQLGARVAREGRIWPARRANICNV